MSLVKERKVRSSSVKSSSPSGRTRPMGATRTNAKESSFSLLPLLKGAVKYVVALAAVGVVFTVIFWLNPKEKLEQFTRKPINAVLIEGQFKFFSKAEAEKIISEEVTGSFIDLNIAKMKMRLEKNVWVDSVSIEREWPDKLVIKISEQQAIARWGNKKFLNLRGDIINVKKVDKMDGLPFLNGNDSYAKDVMQQYLRMGKLLNQHDLKLKSVELDDTLAWTLVINDNIKIKLGRERVWGKLKNLMAAKKGPLSEQFSTVKQVDMRYPSGFAISWKKTKNKQYVAEG